VLEFDATLSISTQSAALPVDALIGTGAPDQFAGSLQEALLHDAAGHSETSIPKGTSQIGLSDSGSETFSEWFEEPDVLIDPTRDPYSLTTDYSHYLSSESYSIQPTHPWDLGINPLVPDSWENWWYGRTPDGSGGAWAQVGNVWQYWGPRGDLIKEYVETSATDPLRVRSVTFTNTTTMTFSITGYATRTVTSGGSVTIYLRPAE